VTLLQELIKIFLISAWHLNYGGALITVKYSISPIEKEGGGGTLPAGNRDHEI